MSAIGRIFIALFLVLMSAFAHAEVDLSAFDRLNDKLDCIIANGGIDSKRAKDVCIDKKSEAGRQVSSFSDSRKRDEKGYFHWKKVSGSPAKAKYKALARGPQADTFIGKKIHDDLRAIGLSSNDMDKYFYPIFNEVLDVNGLLKGEKAQKHQEQWKSMLHDGSRYLDWIERGDTFQYLTFKKGIIQNVVADFDGSLPTYVLPLEDGRELLWIPECGNFAIRDGKHKPEPPREPVVTGPPPEEPFKLSVHREENERRAIVELNAGVWGGAYFGDKYTGEFWGGQGWVYVPVEQLLGTEEQISVGLGVYGAEDNGRSEVSAYKHERSRVLGLLGIKGNGMDEDFNPHWWSVNLGYGPDWLEGGNQDSGYWFKQKTWLGRLYAEYLTQRGEMLYAGFAEGFLDLGHGSNKTSSWSGFPGEGESSARVGGYAEWRFHPNWSVKGVAAMTFGQSDGVTSRFGAELGAYGCYRNGWDQGYGFAIACVGGGANLGQGIVPYVGGNVFVGQVFTHYVEHKRATGVTYVPAEYPKPEMSRIPGASVPSNTIPWNKGMDQPQQNTD